MIVASGAQDDQDVTPRLADRTRAEMHPPRHHRSATIGRDLSRMCGRPACRNERFEDIEQLVCNVVPTPAPMGGNI